MKKFFRRLLDYIFVRHCVICGRSVSVKSDVSICRKCFDKKHTHGVTFQDSGNTVVSALPYIRNIRKAMTRFKFNGVKYYGYTFAHIIYERIKSYSWYDDIDCIVCIPMKNRDRLYNQAEIIAKGVSDISGIHFAKGALVKIKDNPPFYKLDKKQRLKLINGAFKVSDVPAVSGKTVLLVDDIYTTGVTMNEGAKMLLLSGARKVYCAAACYTVSKDVGENMKL